MLSEIGVVKCDEGSWSPPSESLVVLIKEFKNRHRKKLEVHLTSILKKTPSVGMLWI